MWQSNTMFSPWFVAIESTEPPLLNILAEVKKKKKECKPIKLPGFNPSLQDIQETEK